MTTSDFFSKYLELIFDSFSFSKEDILTINSEEEDDFLTRLIAKKAKEVSGKGSYLNRIRNGIMEEECDIFSSFPLRDKPTSFLHIYPYSPKDTSHIEINKVHTASELQSFSLLSDPEEEFINIPFLDIPLPSPSFDNAIKSSSEDLLISLLGSEKTISERKMEKDYTESICEEVNKMEIERCIVFDNEKNNFSFSLSAPFTPNVLFTTSRRKFYPSLSPYPISSMIDPLSVTGIIKTSRSINLYGEEIKELTLYFEKGKIVSIESDKNSKKLFSYYLNEDKNAGKISKIGITKERSDLLDIPYLDKRSLEEKRGVTLTLGGTITNDDDSFVSLLLPIGSKELDIKIVEKNKGERNIYSHGIIKSEEILKSTW